VPKRPYPAGGTGSQTDSGPSTQPVYANDGDGGNQKIEHVLHLDSHELFSQFCTIANLVTIGPRRGLFLSVVNVEDKVLRVWRAWLDERARASREGEARKDTQHEESVADATLAPTAAAAATNKNPNPVGDSDISTSPSILWTDHKRNLGLLVSIKDHKHAVPLLVPSSSAEENQPASYSIEIKGKMP
jgi:hypothetical protein